MDELILNLKQDIIEALNLDMDPDEMAQAQLAQDDNEDEDENINDPEPEEEPEEVIDWGSCTVAQLKEALIERGLSTSGKKADLLERLEFYFPAEE